MSETKNNLQFKDDKLHLKDEVVMKKVSGIPVNQEDETGTIDVDANINIGGSASINGDVTVKGSVTIEGTSYKVIENPEYVWAIIDNDDKILCGIKTDGKFVADIDGIDEKLQEAINQMQTIIDEAQASIDEKIAAIDEKFDFISWIEDPEGRSEITTDSEDKVLSFRDSEGVIHENVGIKAKLIEAEEIKYDGAHIVNTTSIPKDGVIYCERPKFGEMYFEGSLPTDMSDDREPTQLSMVFKIGGVPQFKCNCTLAIQGHGSAQYNKKGYTFEPYNNDWESINIKFGNIIATDSFHLKAYTTDSLHCRDCGGYAIWRDLVKQLDYPYSKFNNIPFELPITYNKNVINIADANYIPAGFPVIFYLNGEFHGLYTIKLKKTRQNYAMEKSIKSEIFLDAINYNGYLKKGFDYTGWELKNPKLKNYEEGGPIPDATVEANIERLFNFLHQIDVNDPSTYENYADYIVLPHWVAFCILEETLHSVDIIANNINLLTWDATHWSICPWDLDLSLGLSGLPHNISTNASDFQYFVLRAADAEERNFWPYFRTIFRSQIQETWTKLRNNGFLSVKNLADYYKNQIDAIPRQVYEDDYNKWGTVWENGIPSFEQIFLALQYKIAWLDTQWLIHDNN